MKRVLSVVLVLVCASVVSPGLNGAPAISVLDPQGAAVLPVDAALMEASLRVGDVVLDDPPTILNQCSRPTLAYSRIVQSPRATSPPTQAEIADLETKLNVLLADRLEAFRQSYPDEAPRTPHVGDYYRQYSAFEVGGRRVIYVNGFPASEVERLAAAALDWRQTPYIACDGGQCCFGVEYYPGTNTFANFSFNWTFSGPIRLRR